MDASGPSYHELDAFCCAWLRNLVAAGCLDRGDVVPGDIRQLRLGPGAGLRTHHFFAGIGVWAHALREAAWPAAVPVWTGSCPCQPFSTAGRRKGVDDERHLWPRWAELIGEHRPLVVLGEQVASPDGRAWLDLVFADLEREGYACGAADLPAAGVGAPHMRQRLYFVAVADVQRCEGVGLQLREWESRSPVPQARGRSEARELADAAASRRGRPQRTGETQRSTTIASESRRPGSARELGDAGGEGSGRHGRGIPRAQTRGEGEREEPRCVADEPEPAGAVGGFWSDVEWIACRDGRLRPAQPGIFPLATRPPARMGRLRAYGNALVAPIATTFVQAVMDALGIMPRTKE